MRQTTWPPEVIALIAERFKALSEPARLEILTSLRDGEKTVTQLVDQSVRGQANVSKHLQSLYAAGFVGRRKEGLYVYYFLADASVLKLCDIMCDRLEKELAARRKALSAT